MKVKVISPFFSDRLYKKGEIIDAKSPKEGLTVPVEDDPTTLEKVTEAKPKRTSKAKS